MRITLPTLPTTEQAFSALTRNGTTVPEQVCADPSLRSAPIHAGSGSRYCSHEPAPRPQTYDAI